MIEPGFPTLLAHPALSFFLALLAFGVAATALVRGGRARADGGQLYWRRLALLSEVLLALALVGLLVFGGRLARVSDQVLLAQTLLQAQASADERVGAIVKAQCAPPARLASGRRGADPGGAKLTPFNPGVAAVDLCALARARPLPGAGVLEWQMAAHSLRDFGARYPGCVDNVFSRNNDCESTVVAATALAAALDQVAAALQASQRHGATMLAIHADSGPGYAMLAALLAAAAISIRIARAFSELGQRI
ncbi:hypothetical protein [Massilia sp. PWRC2]|uniref:hypothetical protein n=1 Tax=Massilia sp. PWRC2 TaxID=2804626 RepID=UPI003CEB7D00